MSFSNSLNDSIPVTKGLEGKALLGIVIDNTDPLKIDRIKVQIPGLFDPDLGEVPWCAPNKFSSFGQGKTQAGQAYGQYGVPAIGSLVKVTLQDGDASHPFYEACLYGVNHVNGAFNGDPWVWGWQDPSGSQLWVNYQSKDWKFTHVSGLTLTYDAQGNKTEYVPGNSNLTVVGNLTAQVQGDMNLAVTGTLTSSAAEWNHTGPTNFNGLMTVVPDVVIAGISFVAHVHGGVVAGGDNTSAPVG